MSTARPVEPIASDAAATGRAYDDAQVKKTDQALSAWREAFERHHEEQLVREAEQLANKPKLAPWFLAGASGLALLVAMAAVVARVVAPPSNVSAVSVTPVEKPAVAAAPAAEPEVIEAPTPEITGPASEEVVAEPSPSALRAPAPAMEGEEVKSAAPALEILGTPRTWDANGYHWVSFEAKAVGPITLTWLDANGQSVLDERTCGFASGDGVLGCRVGRSEGRVDVALAKGAAPGDWRIRACSDGNCADVATIAVAP